MRTHAKFSPWFRNALGETEAMQLVKRAAAVKADTIHGLADSPRGPFTAWLSGGPYHGWGKHHGPTPFVAADKALTEIEEIIRGAVTS